MATVVAENGETSEEGPQQTDVGELRVNGEVNGSYEEPMEVDDSPLKSVKKLNSSDINLISGTTDNDSNSATEHLEQNSGGSVTEVDAAGETEVPEKEEATSSNGFAEEHDKEVGDGSNNVENNVDDDVVDKEHDVEDKENDVDDKEGNIEDKEEDVEDKISNVPDRENIGDYKQSNVEDKEDDQENAEGENADDDVVMMAEEEVKDPLAADENMQEEDKLSVQDDEDKEDVSKNAVDVSDIEQIESNDPLSTENTPMETDSEKDNKEKDNTDNKEKDDTDREKDDDTNKEKDDDANKEKDDEVTEIKDDDSEEVNKDKEDEESNVKHEASNPSEKVEKDEKMDAVEEGEKSDESPEKRKSEEENEKTPDKVKKKKTQQQPINITPRRSSRNVNKPKTYIDEPDIKATTTPVKKAVEDPDIEEIVPQDPLAMDSPASDKKKKTVVVNDPKRLVEIASGNKQSKPGKKEPTLVIIDTNSILSGRGPVPVSPSGSAGPSHSAGYSVLPVALPAQGMYPQPMRHSQAKPVVVTQPPTLAITATPPAATKPPVILPSLTDDMYVVEAPSFIVPYVYEKPPIKPLKNFVEQVEQAIKDIKAQIEKNKEEEAKKEEEVKKAEESEKKSEDSEKKEEDKEKDGKDEKSGKECKEAKEDDVKVEKMDVDSESSKDKDNEESTSKKDKNDTKVEKSTEIKSETKEESDKPAEKPSEDGKSEEVEKKKTSNSYFDNPLGKFFIQIGVNLVQEHVQTDLLRSQKRKKDREGKFTPEVQQAMNSLIRSLEFSKETNEPFKMELKKCEFCSFKTESALVMAHHLETPHMRNYVYRCNFCPLEVRSPHDILYHMEAEHNVRGRLERAPAFHQCPSCPFEDNQKGKLSRHLLSCAKKYRPERNQEPPLDFEPPAKIPRVSRTRPSMSPGTAVYQAAMSGLKQGGAGHPLLPKLVPAPSPAGLIRGRGRPQLMNRYLGDMRNPALTAQQKAMAAQMRPGMLYRPSGSNAQPPVLLPTSYQLAGTQLYQTAAAASVAGNKTSVTAVGASTAKLLQQPSISITPLPRQQPQPPALTPSASASSQANKPGRPATASKATFVICEICDGYIKDLEQLRNHMQWIHKVKIHPKMIYNRPPLNCQKCQFRFFTDQGLERHLLGSHGLVTSSMQEAANKGKDGGRCPVCGRVYQWKLLNHVARDHNMSLKPAHLSYKCTVCTATFGMYKQFENHVYSAHSVVAKRVMDKKPATSAQPSTSSQGDMLKPLKINDEITIIPQPARTKTKQPSGPNRNPQKKV